MAQRGSSLRREPQVELRKLTDDYCEFVLKSTDVSMANALRRIIIAEVRDGVGLGGGGGRAGLARGAHRVQCPPVSAHCIYPHSHTQTPQANTCPQVPTIAVGLAESEVEANTQALHPARSLTAAAPPPRPAPPRCAARRCPPLLWSWLSLRPTPRCSTTSSWRTAWACCPCCPAACTR